MDKVLTFDVWGDFGHFRKFYSTSSPLSFSIPPRTSLSGMIAAIIGLGKEEYLSHFSKKNAWIALRLIKPVNKTRLGLNLINTKDNNWIPVSKGAHSPRTLIRTEFIKDVQFRLYFFHTNNRMYELLKDNLAHHKSFYTPSLGLSELLCNFSFGGEFKMIKHSEEETDIHSVVPVYQLASRKDSIKFENGKKYFKERLPIEMTPERIVTEYNDVIYEAEGKEIRVVPKTYWELENGEKIIFL